MSSVVMFVNVSTRVEETVSVAEVARFTKRFVRVLLF
jgi:hypothetical protein